MVKRVVVCGSGNVGSYAIRGVLDHAQLELVGVGTYSPDKVGSEVRDLVRGESTGIKRIAVADVARTKADCVLLAGKAELDPEPTVALACELLRAGKHVASTALMSLNHPKSMKPEHRERISEACRVGKSAFHGTGINPGFFSDLMSIFLSGLCVGVDSVHSSEIYDYEEKTSKATVIDLLRIGRPLAEGEVRIKQPQAGVAQSPMHIVADAMQVTLDEVKLDYEIAAAERSFEIAATRVEKGTLAGYRRTFTGIVGGRPRIVFDFVHRAARHVAPHWPAPGDESGLRWTNVVEGTPRIVCTVEASTKDGISLPGPASTAARAVNAIPALCAASPGIKTALDLPLFAGSFRARTA